MRYKEKKTMKKKLETRTKIMRKIQSNKIG